MTELLVHCLICAVIGGTGARALELVRRGRRKHHVPRYFPRPSNPVRAPCLRGHTHFDVDGNPAGPMLMCETCITSCVDAGITITPGHWPDSQPGIDS